MTTTERYTAILRNISILSSIGILTSGCFWKKHGDPDHTADHVTVNSILGNMPVVQCDSSLITTPVIPNSIVGTIRILLDESIDNLVQNPTQRVRYAAADSVHDYNDYQNNSTVVPCNSSSAVGACQKNGEIAPYNVNLSGIGLSTQSQWVRVKILIPLVKAQSLPATVPSAVSTLKFFNNQDQQGVYALAVPSALRDKICIYKYNADVNVEDSDQRSLITTFYVWYTYPANHSILPFSIVLLPKTAMGTPVVIDPKILNNG